MIGTDTKARYEHIQSMLIKCGESGCLFLSLCSIAEEVTKVPVDLIAAIKNCMRAGWIDSEFYCKDSLAILEFLTGKKWKRTDLLSLPNTIEDNQYTVEKWYNPRTKFTHFRRRGFDTLVNSITVKEGTKSFYLYEHA